MIPTWDLVHVPGEASRELGVHKLGNPRIQPTKASDLSEEQEQHDSTTVIAAQSTVCPLVDTRNPQLKRAPNAM